MGESFSLESVSEELMTGYLNRFGPDFFNKNEEIFSVLEQFYCSFFPSKFVQSFQDTGLPFKEFYGGKITIKNDSENSIRMDNDNPLIPIIIKPEAVFMSGELEKYLSPMGSIVHQTTGKINPEDLSYLYFDEMAYPCSNNKPIYPFIFRIASMVVGKSRTLFIKPKSLLNLEHKLIEQKTLMRNAVRSKLTSLYLPRIFSGDLNGFDPCRWYLNEPDWIIEAYNGVHVPINLDEAKNNLCTFHNISKIVDL